MPAKRDSVRKKKRVDGQKPGDFWHKARSKRAGNREGEMVKTVTVTRERGGEGFDKGYPGCIKAVRKPAEYSERGTKKRIGKK